MLTRSRPSRARGLKQQQEPQMLFARMSRPSRARGLKHSASPQGARLRVAPLAGAWIETHAGFNPREIAAVAPLAGAWIETTNRRGCLCRIIWSRPSRARGLKRSCPAIAARIRSRAPRGRVD